MRTGRSKPTGLMRLLNAFGNTYRGLSGAWREEAAFRQECALSGLAKDMGSAAVFGSFVLLAINWTAVLLG